MSDSVEDFLSHHGVKGQKWGIRKAFSKASKGDFHRRSGAQKTGLIAGGFVGYTAAGALIKKIMSNPKSITYISEHPEVAGGLSLGILGLSTISTIAGVRLTRNLLQKHGRTPISKLPKKL